MSRDGRPVPVSCGISSHTSPPAMVRPSHAHTASIAMATRSLPTANASPGNTGTPSCDHTSIRHPPDRPWDCDARPRPFNMPTVSLRWRIVNCDNHVTIRTGRKTFSRRQSATAEPEIVIHGSHADQTIIKAIPVILHSGSSKPCGCQRGSSQPASFQP